MTPSRTDTKYLNWIKKQPCANPNCKGNGGDIVPAHQRILGRGGIGIKPPDRDVLPLCFTCHNLEHRGAITFWEQGSKFLTKKFVQNLCNEHHKKFERYSI